MAYFSSPRPWDILWHRQKKSVTDCLNEPQVKTAIWNWNLISISFPSWSVWQSGSSSHQKDLLSRPDPFLNRFVQISDPNRRIISLIRSVSDGILAHVMRIVKRHPGCIGVALRLNQLHRHYGRARPLGEAIWQRLSLRSLRLRLASLWPSPKNRWRLNQSRSIWCIRLKIQSIHKKEPYHQKNTNIK